MDLTQLLESMEENATRAGDTPAGHGWRHAALICRLSWSVPRMLRQLENHARFYDAEQPGKADAYRGAARLLEALTGEQAAAVLNPFTAPIPPMPLELHLFATP